MVKGQSWTLANQGPRPYFECAGFEQTTPAKPLLRTQVFPFWSSFHLISGLCCTSRGCFSPDFLDLGFSFRWPHQNHWINDSWGPVYDNFLFRDIALRLIHIYLFIESSLTEHVGCTKNCKHIGYNSQCNKLQFCPNKQYDLVEQGKWIRKYNITDTSLDQILPPNTCVYPEPQKYELYLEVVLKV